MNRAKTNYWIDLALGLAGVISAVSGLAFLLPGDMTSGALGISYQAWSAAHTWSSLVLIAGVGAHLALHWKWMVAMTKRALSAVSQPATVEPLPSGAQGKPLTRRAFLIFGGTAAGVAGLIVAGYKAVFDANAAGTDQSDTTIAAAQQTGAVACPWGVVDDPYPGRCRHYRDSNGDGFCDYSVAGSGTNSSPSISSDGSFSGGFSRHRSGFGQP